MPKNLTYIDDLRTYFAGVIERANHHANGVNEIALPLLGAVVWQADNFSILQRKGQPKNVAWMTKGDKTLYFRYDHNNGKIEIHESSHNGALLRTFDNSNTVADVKNFFAKL